MRKASYLLRNDKLASDLSPWGADPSAINKRKFATET